MNDAQLTYLNRRKEDLIKLVDSLANNDFEFPQILGHRLKGHGNTFGFLDISLIGKKLEEFSKKQDLENAKKMSEELSMAIDIGFTQIS